jgi:hypothetical protein
VGGGDIYTEIGENMMLHKKDTSWMMIFGTGLMLSQNPCCEKKDEF